MNALARVAVPLLVVFASGCIDETYERTDRTDRSPSSLRMDHHVGGTHHRTVIEDGSWFVSQGVLIEALDPHTGKVRGECRLAEDGSAGSVVDLVRWQGSLMAVLDESAVVRIDPRGGRDAEVVEVIDAAALGIRPKQLSVVGESLYVSGLGGVVRLPDRTRFLPDQAQVGSVAMSSSGPVAVVDRRVVSLENGQFVGAATQLVPLPPSLGIVGGIAFVLQYREGASVGIMGPDIREISADVVPGIVRRLRVIDSRLWVVTDTELVTWDLSRGKVADPLVLKLKGGRDLDAVNENYFGVVGSFGRAVLRLEDDATGDGDEFIRAVRTPGRLDVAISDQRTIIASSPEGTWSYPIRGKPTLTDRAVPVWGIPARDVSAVWGSAKLVSDSDDEPVRRVEISSGVGSAASKGTWSAPLDGTIWVLALVDGDLWIGHERGISVLRHRTAAEGGTGAFPVQQSKAAGTMTGTSPLVEIASITLEGPVIHLFPLRTGRGASWVSQWGGLGVVEWVSESAASRRRGTSAGRSSPRRRNRRAPCRRAVRAG